MGKVTEIESEKEIRVKISDDAFFHSLHDLIQKAILNQDSKTIQIEISNLTLQDNINFEHTLGYLYKKHDSSEQKIELKFRNVTFETTVNFKIERSDPAFINIAFDNCQFESLILIENIHPAGFSFKFTNNCQITFLYWTRSIFGNYFFGNSYISQISNFPDRGSEEIKRGAMAGIVVFENVTFGCKKNSVDPFQLKNLDFSGMFHFSKCSFIDAPNFTGSTLNHQTIFSQCYFFDKSDTAIAHYRLLRSEMQRLGNEREAIMFGSLELETYHRAEFQGKKISGSDKIEKLASSLYRGFSSYGRDVLTPFLWITLVSTFLFYGVYDLFDLSIVDIKGTSPEWMASFFQEDRRIPFIRSLWNTLGPISLLIDSDVIQASNATGASLFILQKSISSVMWFLWVLQIRRRFKLS